MKPNRSNVLLSYSIVNKKRKKNRKPPLQQKKRNRREEDSFLTLCHLYLATFAIKKNLITVSPILGHFCIRFSREEDAATVSPLGGPVHLILSRRKMTLNCVTFRWSFLLPLSQRIFF